MLDYASQQRRPQRHALGLAAVVVLHILLFWVIQSGLSREITQKVQVIADVLLLPAERPVLAPPPPHQAPAPAPAPAKNLAPAPTPPAPVVPALAPAVTAPAPQAITAAAPAAPPVAATVAPPSAVPVRTAAVVQAAQCEKPEYPSASRRLEEEGTVHLRFLVGVDGKVLQSEVEKSSGFRRLDEAARSALSRCQFKPATLDGKPEQSWASMRYTWRLE